MLCEFHCKKFLIRKLLPLPPNLTAPWRVRMSLPIPLVAHPELQIHDREVAAEAVREGVLDMYQI